MNQTYDPILESVPLKRFRTTAPRGPAMGTALVLERTAGEPVVVEAGGRIPEAYLGNYHTLHRVDVANRAIGFMLSSPSADPAFPFTVAISCGCQVVDPVLVVRDGVRDMATAVQSWLTGLVRGITVRYDALRPTDAEAEIMSQLRTAYAPDAVRLSGFVVEVSTRDVADIVSAQRELRVQEMRRDAMRPVAHGGREEMLAHVMAISDGDPTPLLDREQEAKEHSTQASLLALRALMGSDKLEEFNTSRISEKVMTEFFPGGEPLLGGKRPGIRDRIERKRKAIDGAGPVVDGVSASVDESGRSRDANAPATPSDGDGKPTGDKPGATASPQSEPNSEPRSKPSRVRGLLRREDG